MAKKASKKSAKRKTTKEAPVEIVRLESGKSISIGLHDVIKAVKMVEKHGHLGKLVSRAKRQELVMMVPAETVNSVKEFIVKFGMHKDRVGKHMVQGKGRPPARGARRPTALRRAAWGDPNQCDFGRRR